MRKLIIGVALAGALTACGGGGGGSDGGPPPAPAPATFNADSALSSALTNGALISGLTGTDTVSNVKLTASLGYAPGTDTNFDGALQKRSIQTATVSAPGVTPQSAVTNIFYTTGPARFIGATSPTTFTTYTAVDQLPTAGSVGQSGTFATGLIFSDAAKAIQLGTVTVAWSIEPDTASTAFACLTSTIAGTQVAEKDCLRIDPAGTILGGRVTLTGPAVNITFQ